MLAVPIQILLLPIVQLEISGIMWLHFYIYFAIFRLYEGSPHIYKILVCKPVCIKKVNNISYTGDGAFMPVSFSFIASRTRMMPKATLKMPTTWMRAMMPVMG